MPHRCDANYSHVTARNDGEELHAMYSERLLMLDKPRKRVYIVNGVDRKPLYIGSNEKLTAHCRILDCTGREVKNETITIDCSPARVDVPMCGMAVIDLVI